MDRTARDTASQHPAPVERIELNEDKLHKRFILVVLLLALGVGAIAGGVLRLLRVEPGWREVEASGGGFTCAGDFALYYDLGAGELSPSRELRALQGAYTAACTDAYAIFAPHQRLEGVANLASLSDHVNEITQVHPALYRALEQVEAAGSRLLFLSPVYEVYRDLLRSADPQEAASYDPLTDAALAEWCARAAAYAADPDAVGLELLGEDRVRLRASEEYLAFLAESGVEDLLDFFWMEDAFRADYLAQRLQAEGFSHGCLRSRSGVTRCFTPGECPFTEAFYHRNGTDTDLAARLQLRGGMTAVSLRAYPVSTYESERFFSLPDGSIRTPYVDPEDGVCRTALPELTGVSESLSCAELTLLLADVFIGEGAEEADFAALQDKGADTLRFRGDTLVCSAESLLLPEK